MVQPSTKVSRLAEKQSTSLNQLEELLDGTPLATIALVRDGHPLIFPIGFARIGDELVIHGSTGSPWLRDVAAGAPGCHRRHHAGRVLVAPRRIRIIVPVPQCGHLRRLWTHPGRRQGPVPRTLTDTFIPGRVARLRAEFTEGTGRHRSAASAGFRNRRGRSRSGTAGRRIPTRTSPPVCGRAWYPHNDLRGPGVPRLRQSIPVPDSVLGMRGLRNRRKK